MTPRQPPHNASDSPQDESLPKDRDALDGSAPANDSAKPRPTAERQDAAQPDDADRTQVEIDRIEAYLRGPTAFSA
ncbi:MAG TPA: hypothetical protein VK434_09510 [Microvirga sp.]|jgi:hypothetical protein|nr:hypothetical protein [Microvirga sp.]